MECMFVRVLWYVNWEKFKIIALKFVCVNNYVCTDCVCLNGLLLCLYGMYVCTDCVYLYRLCMFVRTVCLYGLCMFIRSNMFAKVIMMEVCLYVCMCSIIHYATLLLPHTL